MNSPFKRTQKRKEERITKRPSYEEMSNKIDELYGENDLLEFEKRELVEVIEGAAHLEFDRREEICETLCAYYDERIAQNDCLINDISQNRYSLYDRFAISDALGIGRLER